MIAHSAITLSSTALLQQVEAVQNIGEVLAGDGGVTATVRGAICSRFAAACYLVEAVAVDGGEQGLLVLARVRKGALEVDDADDAGTRVAPGAARLRT